MAEIASVLATSTFQNPTRQSDVALKAAAMELETSFLTEMLKAAGAGDARKSFGGGIGEDQFTSFLLGAQAEKIVEAGGIGLAETLFHALAERTQNE